MVFMCRMAKGMKNADGMAKSAVYIGMTALVVGCAAATMTGGSSKRAAPAVPTRFVSRAAAPWQPLNPARGDKSPKAANLWGDLRKDEATGFLVQFVDGFSSPPHVHNITYRGVVIDGLVYNDDPDAAKLWMGPGSYWVQPAGDVHITAASGGLGLAYIEIESGPYLVRPPEQAFDSEDRVLNVLAERIRWRRDDMGFETVRPWGEAKRGSVERVLVRMPGGFSGSLTTDGLFRGVVVRGAVTHSDRASQALAPGSYFESGPSVHGLRCDSNEACVLYYRTDGEVRIVTSPPR